MSDYEAWLVDLDGTLYKAKPLKMAMAAELALLGASAYATLRVFRRHHEILRDEWLSDPSVQFAPSPFQEQLTRAAHVAGVSEDVMRGYVEDWMIRRPCKWMRRFARQDLLERIRTFRAAGGKTALVSDYPANIKAEAMGIAPLFDVIVSSGDHPRLFRMKPSPDPFVLAAEELGVNPSACLVIGDREDADGEGARAAGMDFELIT